MRILITGRGKAGSWKVRAEQFGEAMGATVKQGITLADCRAHDVVVLVKRPSPELVSILRVCDRPVVWDVVDAYPQPVGCHWSKQELVDYIRRQWKALGRPVMVAATEQMRRDLEADICIPHHGWDRGTATVRPLFSRVGYEGEPNQIAGIRGMLESECHKRGLEFVVNPTDYLSLDAVVAMRDEKHDGYAARNWKSGIKQANAHIAGLPFISTPEAGYCETAVGGECYVHNRSEFGTALDWLSDEAGRRSIHDRFVAGALRLPDVAARYKAFLCAQSA